MKQTKRLGKAMRVLLWQAEDRPYYGLTSGGRRPAVRVLGDYGTAPPWLGVSGPPRPTKDVAGDALRALVRHGFLLERSTGRCRLVWSITPAGLEWLQEARNRYAGSMAGKARWLPVGGGRCRWSNVSKYGWQVLAGQVQEAGAQPQWYFTMTDPDGRGCGWIRSREQSEQACRREAESTWFSYTAGGSLAATQEGNKDGEAGAKTAGAGGCEDAADFDGDWDRFFDWCKKLNAGGGASTD